ncbi:MAG: galactose-1-phosphate uridylyltransferase [Planctomycetes bacterium]|nr:galactose-1-phosphate uridylyltransferase [Planctomycetota bacterium]
MEEIRTDPISGRKVLIAEGRSERPSDYGVSGASHVQKTEADDNCPFCAGAEHRTPSPIREVLDEAGRWQVRVIPNKYPAVDAHSTISELGELRTPFSPPDQAYGSHEVVVESPRHLRDVTEISVEHLAIVLQVYRDRLQHWSTDQRMRYVQVFKNFGFAGGASIEHIHSQIVAIPFVPESVESELQGASRYHQRHQRCIFCDLLTQELEQRSRLVLESGRFAAFCAYAGRQPCETWVMPTAHQSDYRMLNDEDTYSLAKMLRQVLQKLHILISQLSYNLILHTLPFSNSGPDHYHWHFEIVPRTTHLAGFEWGTGLFINPLSPERAAKMLRETKV